MCKFIENETVYFTGHMCILRHSYVMVIANFLFVCFLKLAVVYERISTVDRLVSLKVNC